MWPVRQSVAAHPRDAEAGWITIIHSVLWGIPGSLLAFTFLGGTIMGWCQWLVLRKYISLPREWIINSGLKWGLSVLGFILIWSRIILDDANTLSELTIQNVLGILAFLFIIIPLISIGGSIAGDIIGKRQIVALWPCTKSEYETDWIKANRLAFALVIVITGLFNIAAVLNEFILEHNLILWGILQVFIGIAIGIINGSALVQMLKISE